MKTFGLILIVSIYIVRGHDDPIPTTITSESHQMRRRGKIFGLLGLVAGLNLIDEVDDDDEGNSIDTKSITFSSENDGKFSKLAVLQKNGRFDFSKFI